MFFLSFNFQNMTANCFYLIITVGSGLAYFVFNLLLFKFCVSTLVINIIRWFFASLFGLFICDIMERQVSEKK